MRPYHFIWIPFLVGIGLVVTYARPPSPSPTDQSADSNAGKDSSKNLLPQSFLDNIISKEIKQNVEDVLDADLKYLQESDELQKVSQDIVETEKEIKYTRDNFEKKKVAGILTRKLEDIYTKYENLKKDEDDWNRVEESITQSRWKELESGGDVFNAIQRAKEKVQFQMKKLKPGHDVYASKKQDLESENETPEETRQQVYDTTLNNLNSRLDALHKDQERLKLQIQNDAREREKTLLTAVDAWRDTKKQTTSSWGMFRGIFDFSGKADLSGVYAKEIMIIPSLMRIHLRKEFKDRMQNLVLDYESSTAGDLDVNPEDDDITKAKKEIKRDKLKYHVENNILGGNRYLLPATKRSENPLQKENALLAIIEGIIAKGKAQPDKNLDKDMAREITEKTKMLVTGITNSNACNLNNKSFSLTESEYKGHIDRVLDAFESAASDLVMVPPVDAENERRKQEEVEKRHTLVVNLMTEVSGLVNCVQTLTRIKKTFSEAEAWRAQS